MSRPALIFLTIPLAPNRVEVTEQHSFYPSGGPTMFSRFTCALAVLCLTVVSLSAQTVRFDTNVGTFDMELNPTGNPNLQGHVDNLLAYVEAGRYDTTVINRAATGFVLQILQMGGFTAPSLTLDNSFLSESVATFDPVEVQTDSDNNITSFDASSLSNTRGTVCLALSSVSTTINGESVGVPDASSGTSSFFINLDDNSGTLDPGVMNFNNNVGFEVPTGGFLPFAEISNMETVDLIMNLPQINLDSSNQNLGVTNVPLLESFQLVIIERAFVVDTVDTITASSQASSTSSDTPITAADMVAEPIVGTDPAADLSVPEPTTFATALAAGLLLGTLRRRRSF